MASIPPVTFNWTTFLAMFPEFSACSSDQGQGWFNRATGSIVANSCQNPAYGDGNLQYLVYLATAHIAWLNCPRDDNGNPAASGEPGSPLVGRISSAVEGSVNLALEWEVGGPQTQFEAFLQQTKYGAELLAALMPYRTARYLARPTRVSSGFGLTRYFGRA